MAITFPLARAAFWELLRFDARPEFVVDHRQKQSESGGGDTFRASFGRPKWVVNVVLSGGWHDVNLTQEADLKTLIGRDGTFLAFDIRRPFPASDPTGSILAAATVQVKAKGSNNRSLSLKGLPNGFVVTKADKLSIGYGSGKVFLGEFVEGGAASGLGETVELEIQPSLPGAVAVNDVVSLVKPCGKFKVLAGSYRPSSGQGNISSGASFSAVSVP